MRYLTDQNSTWSSRDPIPDPDSIIFFLPQHLIQPHHHLSLPLHLSRLLCHLKIIYFKYNLYKETFIVCSLDDKLNFPMKYIHEIVNNNHDFAAVLMTMTCHFPILASVIEKVTIFVDICIISFLFEILPLLMLFNPADCIANSS